MTFVVATEDELSECVALKLLEKRMSDQSDIQLIRRNGNGYLRSRMKTFVSLAKRVPVLMLTDLDHAKCPPALIQKWAGDVVLPGKLFFRVAVREVEAWLLADREGVAKYLGISPQKISASPEELRDPKRHLLDLAKGAPRALRNELLPPRGSVAAQGFGYNSSLREFVGSIWSPVRAAERCKSLRRAIDRLSDLPKFRNAS